MKLKIDDTLKQIKCQSKKEEANIELINEYDIQKKVGNSNKLQLNKIYNYKK